MGHHQGELSKMNFVIMILAAVVSIGQSVEVRNDDNGDNNNINCSSPGSRPLDFNSILEMLTPGNRIQFCWIETTTIVEMNGQIISINREHSIYKDNDGEDPSSNPNQNIEEYHLCDRLKDEVRNFSSISRDNGKIIRQNRKVSFGSGFIAKSNAQSSGNSDRKILEITIISDDDFNRRTDIQSNITNSDSDDIVGAPEMDNSDNSGNRTESNKMQDNHLMAPLSSPQISKNKHLHNNNNNYLLQLILRLKNSNGDVQNPPLTLGKSKEVKLPRAEVVKLSKNRGELNSNLNDFMFELLDPRINQDSLYDVNTNNQRVNRNFDRALEEKNPKDIVPSYYEVQNFKRDYNIYPNYPDTGSYKNFKKYPIVEENAGRNFNADTNRRSNKNYNFPIKTRPENGVYTNRRYFGERSQNGRSFIKSGLVNEDRRTAVNLKDDDGNFDDFGSYVPRPLYVQTGPDSKRNNNGFYDELEEKLNSDDINPSFSENIFENGDEAVENYGSYSPPNRGLHLF